jgi:hypothetical protein
MLRRFQKYYYLLFSFLVIASCSPDLDIPETIEGDVVFQVSAMIDGEAITLAAGKANHYMFTDYEVDSNGVSLFQGILGEVGCENCPNSLGFEFAQASGNTVLDDLFSTINQPMIAYRNALTPMEITGYNTDFEIDLEGTAPFSLVWDFGDGTPLYPSLGTFQYEYAESGVYNVCVEIMDAAGCQSIICRTVSTDNSMNCSINFSVYHVNGLNYHFYPYSAGVPPFNYQWNIQDSVSPQNVALASPTILMNQIGIMPIEVSMTDGNNCSSSIMQLVDFNNPDAICLNHFDYHAEPIFTPGTAQDYSSTFAIKYINENGVTYSSALGEQPTFSFLNILETEDFFMNDNNQPTKKITMEMACRLFDMDGDYVDLKNGSGTIAVAYQD